MIIRIDVDSDVPIYTQLTNQIIEGIVFGKIEYGDSLPSVRTFAADLGVNMHTVNKSYHDLEKRGIIKIVPKSGAVISPLEDISIETKESIISKVQPILAECLVLGVKKEELQKSINEILAKMYER